MLDWRSCSETAIGMVYEGKVAQGYFTPELFYPSYDDIFEMIANPRIDREDIIIQYGNVIQACVNAAHSFNGVAKELDWREMLLRSREQELLATDMEKASRKLKEGRAVEIGPLIEKLKTFDSGGRVGGVRATDIEESELKKIPSGWAAIDDNLGGYPEYGLVVVAGREGTGKTTMIGRIVTSFIKQHPGKDVEVFTMEMLNGEMLTKIFDFDEEFRNDPELRKHIILNEDRLTPDEVAAEIAMWPDLGLVVIDYADLMVKEKDDNSYGQMYDTLMRVARENVFPIIAFAQFKTTFSGGVPHPEHIYFMGTGRKNAWSVWCIWSPGNETGASVTDDDREGFPTTGDLDDELWLLAWKQRGGWLANKQGPLGILMQKAPKIIWPEDGRYFRYAPQNAPKKKRERKEY